jgi:hypothetical protein
LLCFAKGEKQPKLHTKQYLFISDDLHHQIKSRPGNPEGGLLCQDCHGTPEQFPWELPLGHGEEFNQSIGDKPRGLADSALQETAISTVMNKLTDTKTSLNRDRHF